MDRKKRIAWMAWVVGALTSVVVVILLSANWDALWVNYYISRLRECEKRVGCSGCAYYSTKLVGFGPRVIPSMSKILFEEQDAPMGNAAAHVLSMIGEPALPVLEEARRSSNLEIRGRGMDGLMMMLRDYDISGEDPRMVKRLKKIMGVKERGNLLIYPRGRKF